MPEELPEPTPGVEMKILGLEADTYTEEELGQPLEAFAIIKVFANGQIEHRLAMTEGLTSVEAGGMLWWAEKILGAAWNAPVIIVGAEDVPDDEEGDDNGEYGCLGA